jgi:hypothetical protein
LKQGVDESEGTVGDKKVILLNRYTVQLHRIMDK